MNLLLRGYSSLAASTPGRVAGGVFSTPAVEPIAIGTGSSCAPTSGAVNADRVRPPRGRCGPPTNETRNQQMIAMFLSGKTQPEIGAIFGVHGKSVGRTLRLYGVRRSEGGKEVAARQRRDAERFARHLAELSAMDCGIAEFADQSAFDTSLQRFREQRGRARDRGLPWSLSFGAWWRIWQASGLWHVRGRSGADSAVMARFHDAGGYSKDNVYITTLAVNFSESHFVRGHQAKVFRGHDQHLLSLARF